MLLHCITNNYLWIWRKSSPETQKLQLVSHHKVSHGWEKWQSCAISPKQCLKMESSPWVRKAVQSHIIATHLHGVHLHVFFQSWEVRESDFSLWFSKYMEWQKPVPCWHCSWHCARALKEGKYLLLYKHLDYCLWQGQEIKKTKEVLKLSHSDGSFKPESHSTKAE